MAFLIQKKLLIQFCLFLGLKLSKGMLKGNPEQQLHKKLFNSSYYSVDLLPRNNTSAIINVSFGFELVKIVEVNAKEQSIVVYGWTKQKWENPLLSWNKSDFDDIDEIHVEPRRVWVPDIFLYNNKDDQDHVAGGRTSYRSRVILSSNGTSTWYNPMMFTSLCRIKVHDFPFDVHECQLKFGSWTYNLRTLDLIPMKHYKFPSKFFQENGEWEIYKVKMKRNEHKYQCCENKFADVTVTIKMGRESADYLINLIVPCCLISSMIFLGFVLPPESGERIGLSITVLLAMTVFQQLTSEIMPSYDFPILGQYYFAIILEVGVSVVVTTTILNFYHRTSRKMPRWMKRLVIDWMATIVFLSNTPEKRKILRRKTTRRSRRIKQRRINDNGVPAIGDDGKDQHNQGFTVTFSDPIYSCGSTGSESKGTEMENLGCAKSYGLSTYPFKLGSHEVTDDQIKEEARPYKDDLESLSEDELAIRHWEWTLVARILDRFFLVVAIICGIVTVAAIFLRAPMLWDHLSPITKDNPQLMVDE